MMSNHYWGTANLAARTREAEEKVSRARRLVENAREYENFASHAAAETRRIVEEIEREARYESDLEVRGRLYQLATEAVHCRSHAEDWQRYWADVARSRQARAAAEFRARTAEFNTYRTPRPIVVERVVERERDNSGEVAAAAAVGLVLGRILFGR